MPIETECPSCQVPVTVPNEVDGKKITCPDCAYGFVVRSGPPARGRSQGPKKAAAPPRARSEERLRKDAPARSSLSSPRDEEDEPRPRKSSRAPDVAKTSGSLLLPLLLVGAVGACLLLVVAGAGLWFLLRPARVSGPVAAVTPPPVVAPPLVAPPAPQVPPPLADGPRLPVGGAPVAGPPVGGVPALPVDRPAEGGEEFVDLPERREGVAVVPGLPGTKDAPPGAPNPDPPGGARVVLTDGAAQRVPGRAGMVFRVQYRFTGATPQAGGLRYVWVIQTNRGSSFSKKLTAAELRPEGVLEGRAIGAMWLDSPYRTYLAVEKLVPGRGWQEERVSDVLTFR